MKVVRTDRELTCPGIDAGLLARGVQLVTLPDSVTEDELAREVGRRFEHGPKGKTSLQKTAIE